MKSYEALQKAIHGRTVEHAKRLGLSTSQVNKWQEPSTDWSDSGAYNPLDRIETIMEKSLAEGTDPKAALAPVQYLAHRFNLVMIPLPAVDKADVGDLTHELMDTVKEFGDLAAATAEALADGRISRSDAADIEREAWELIQQTAVFVRKVQEAAR